ncbi:MULTISPECIES: autotransporter domain-containing protein [unclassified Lysobacter]|uniref:autotransporter domain-containing protein n=1 Tax=unclassified Lysobacter TaxID=2635362 RepID=UPI001C246304|nr:autotransporter domain-containing protein [Lysobacter sp. MMG2]MBU8976697.1 autotransporter domain-containing protein [Lysobacter sp. MMG2]
MMTPVRSVLAAALALATAPAFAQDYSQTVFFGDSLTDAGYFRPALVAQAGASAAILGRFTTNPGLVWSEHVATELGTNGAAFNQGGTNYAIGGAMVSTDRAGLTPQLPTLSLRSQISRYLTANGGAADPNALYTVWGGANDLFAAAAAPAQAQAIVGAAVTGQVANVMTLQNAGAQYILVPNVPDLGITPQFRAQGAAGAAAGTALATGYNNGLYSGLASAGARFIPVDTFSLLREIVANPAPYGITNTTGTACNPQVTAQSITCNPGTYATPNAPDTYVFADGVHPTTKAHEILADYALSLLDAPRQLAVLPHSEAMVGRARADRVGAQAASRPDVDGMRWWADVRGDSQRYGHGDNYDGFGPTLSVGLDWANGGLVYGGFAGYGQQKMDWGLNRGGWDQDDASLGGYLGWTGGAAWVNGQVSYTWVSYDIDRRVNLGPTSRVHSGSPDGTNLTAAINAGWNFGDGAFKHGPVVQLLSQTIEVDAYDENSTEATALSFGKQEFDSLIGSVGWQVNYALNDHLQPYAKLTYDHEFEDSADEATASLRSLPGVGSYAVPGLSYDQDYGTLLMGARTQLFGLQTDIGASLTVAQKGGNDATLFVSFGGGF